MYTVEVIGPPGAGKSFYARNRASASDVYTRPDGRIACLIRGHSGGNIVNRLPDKVRDAIARRVWRYYRPDYERDFFARYPGVLETSSGIARISEDKRHILDLLFNEGAWYQLMDSELSARDVYVSDDGLYQLHLRLASADRWTVDDIFERLPRPDEVVLIDTPAKQCLEQQKTRERGLASKLDGLSEQETIEKLDQMRSSAMKMATKLEDRGVDVTIISRS